MNFICETADLQAYLECSAVIDYDHPLVQEQIVLIRSATDSPEEQARLAFEFARDQIRHSFDLDSELITISASSAIAQHEGICYAKSHVLAALLRGLSIPAGFCYQRVLRKGTVDSGYAIHGLNAFYLPERKQWFRVDPRGNKPGIHSEFSLEQEQLAYPIRSELGEIDYPYIFAQPPIQVLDSMTASSNCRELFHLRPESLEVD